MDFWLTPTSIESYEFLNNFKRRIIQFNKKLAFSPKYKFKDLKNEFKIDFLKEHCFSNGKFCSVENPEIDSKSILEEGIR